MRQTNGILNIDLNALGQNYALIQRQTKAAVAGVVKADGYGLGLEPVVQTLNEGGCRQFFVATLDEALALRQLAPKTVIYKLGGLYKGAEEEYEKAGILPVLSSLDEIGRWQSLARTLGKPLPAAIQVDTGMNRLGLRPEDARQIAGDKSLLEGIEPDLILSHFACADEAGHEMTARQAGLFKEITGYFPDIPKSLANSSGIFRDQAYHYDLVRPGYALYGGNPVPEAENPMSSVVTLETRVLQIRDIKKGESIGYGASHSFDADGKTATVAAGYADGILRSGSNKAALYWQGQRCPVVGRVSMDLISVDLSGISGPLPSPGDRLEILGPNQSIDDLAAACGTIGYEILTALGSRYQRVYT